jgi:anthranilate phosphoribosyltransferase
MVPLTVEDADAVVDTCGTGGGRVTTFNISTAAALVAAGAGVRVAKHGNRSFTSRSGSADVLEALGVAIDVSPDRMAEALVRAGITFMFAPLMHPAMKHVGPVRRELAVPTVMNIVGPLANPARVGRQVVGVADRQRLPLIAGALQALGAVRAMVVYGEPGMDEISPLGVTTVLEVRAGEPMSEWHIDPGAYGIAPAQLRDEELAGGDPSDNAAVIEEVLRGEGAPTATLAVELNAAAAIYVADRTATFTDAVAAARESLRSGAALHRLERLREVLGQGRA